MGDHIITLRFKYRGLIDFKHLYSEGKQFFVIRNHRIHEKVYKDKRDEFEFEWAVENPVNEYDMAVYEVKVKAIDMTPVVKDGKTLYSGKLQMSIKAEIESNYQDPHQKTPAGEQHIFNGDSWLHNLYKKVTYRDRYEMLAGDIFVTANNFQTLFKEICNAETK